MQKPNLVSFQQMNFNLQKLKLKLLSVVNIQIDIVSVKLYFIIQLLFWSQIYFSCQILTKSI